MSIKITNRYDSNNTIQDSANYPEFSGTLLKKFLEFLVKKNANLENANLENAYLENANLENAYLENANLENANLENAYLKNANLKNANLKNAYLENANLKNANLKNANLKNAYLPIFCKWSVRFTLPFTIHIGCKSKTIKEWDIWFKSDETFDNPRSSHEFKRIYANYLAVRSYLKECHKQKLFHEVVVKRNGIKQKEWQVNQ